MKTIRATGIALSMAALMIAAMAAAASAQVSGGSLTTGPVVASPSCTGNACLYGVYSFRLDPATGFAADLASTTTDPGNVAGAARQSVGQAGQFTADGNGNITAGESFVTTDDNSGNTVLIDYTWTGSYSLAGDGTGSLTVVPDGVTSSTWKCYDMTSPTTLADWTASNAYPDWTPPNWAKTTVYLANAHIRPTSNKNPAGYVFVTNAGGTSSGSEPSWPQTVNTLVTDGSVSWKNIGVPQVVRPSVGNAGNYVYESIVQPNWAATTQYRTNVSQIVPSSSNGGNGHAYRMTGAVTPPDWAASSTTLCNAVGKEVYPSLNNAGKYVFECTTPGTTGGAAPTWPQAMGNYVTDGTAVWEGIGKASTSTGISAGITGTTAPTWNLSPTTTTDGYVIWTDEGPAGASGSSEPSSFGQGISGVTLDAGITWKNVGWAPLTPVACFVGSAPIRAGAASYSLGLSLTYGRVELVETDAVVGGGAKIFMTGEAAKRP